jgi:uncharacterized membrane protein YgdD (TMEM256/DUF423 family)
MAKNILQTGAILGALSVAIGAFAAHGLKQHLDTNQLEIFHTGVRYQYYHTFAILIVGLLALKYPQAYFRNAFRFFLIGILLFSGSLYLLSSRFALGIESWTWLGPITPIGGLFFIIGWIFLFLGLRKLPNDII